ncbi:MAG: TetR family transcriptional regulator [Micromonosporaceae bacterium]|nr:TetR family transcriptional regulator [Micromonosporaceae bacterium]
MDRAHPDRRAHPDNRASDDTGATPGLRLRRRIRTKQLVQSEALRLFADKGYEQTTVDDIAHAAAISPRTFFRYFPTKEDVVLWDEYDDVPLPDLLHLEPGVEPVVTVASAVRRLLAEVYTKDPELTLARMKLSLTIPEVRARFMDTLFVGLAPLYRQTATAIGAPPDDLGLQVMLAAIFGMIAVVIQRWQEGDGHQDLMKLYDEGMAALLAGAADLARALPVSRRSTRTGARGRAHRPGR